MKKDVFHRVVLVLQLVLLAAILYVLVDISGKLDVRSQAKPLQKFEPRNVQLDVSDNPVIGDSSALVELVVFSDFQCPHCYTLYQQIEKLKEKYIETGILKLVFMNYPLKSHVKANFFAKISEYAFMEGKFGQVYSRLYEQAAEIDQQNYLEYFADIIEDTMSLTDYINQPSMEVAEDLKRAASINVKGTPVFIVNGTLYLGTRTDQEFFDIIEKAVSETESMCND
ncbi:MAG: hypothetical protein C0594_06170 [Marinilabiliales bacterium]|mgnify:CR=1 FL=1|nr:MAG: hypothetical protein C0594_06170 [Marinilabiliales bacterium]